MKTSSFKQQVTVNTTPQVVYDLLMDAKKHSALIGSKVKISQKVGGMFEVYDGYAHGENLQLLPGQRIVQAWRANVEAAWDRLDARYDERFRRMWRFYLAASMATFRTRRSQLWQVVFSNGGVPGGYLAAR